MQGVNGLGYKCKYPVILLLHLALNFELSKIQSIKYIDMTAPLLHPSQNSFNLLSILSTSIEENNQLSIVRTFKRGHYIFRSGQGANQVYIVKAGRVKISARNDDGKEMIKKIVTQGEIFGELSMLGEAVRKDFAMAMEATEVYAITIDELQYLMQKNRALSIYLMQLLGRQLIEFEQRLESLVFDNSRNRIINFLETLVQKRGQRVGYEMLVRKFLTHQEIANLTATSRQTVTMVLNELRNKNILTFNRRRLLIRDMQLLRAEAA
jgi:CRP-like cAMP-binding protein